MKQMFVNNKLDPSAMEDVSTATDLFTEAIHSLFIKGYNNEDITRLAAHVTLTACEEIRKNK